MGMGKGQGEERGREKTGLARVFEERALPAIVVRCAQHLVLLGVQEEGLFRVPGRSAHVTKLRAEFDAGAFTFGFGAALASLGLGGLGYIY